MRIRKMSYFYQLFLVLALLMLIPILIVSFINYRNANSTLEAEIQSANTHLLARMRDEVDSNLQETNEALIDFSLRSPELQFYLGRRKFESEGYYTAIKLLDRLTELKAQLPFLDDLVVIMKSEPFLLTSTGSYSLGNFIQTLRNEYFGRMMTYQGLANLDSLPAYRKSSDLSYDAVALTYGLPFRRGQSEILLTGVISTAKILKSITRIGLTKEGYIVVTDRQGAPVCTDSRAPLPASTIAYLKRSGKSPAETSGIAVLAGTAYVITDVISESSGWHYASFVPYTEISSRTSSVKMILYYSLFAFTGVSLVLAFLASRYLYDPVRSLLASIGAARGPFRDEFGFIKTNINGILLSNKDLRTELLRTVPQLQEKVLRDLLHDTVGSEDPGELVARHHIRFPHRRFQVMVIASTEGGFVGGLPEKLSEFGENAYLVTEDKLSIIIFNFNSLDIGRFVGLLRPLPLKVTLGEEYGDLALVHHSYREAIESLEYTTLTREFEFLPSSRVSDRRNAQFLFPAEAEKQISARLDEKDFEGVRESLEILLRRHFRTEMPRHYLFENLGSLWNLLSRKCESLKCDLGIILGPDFDLRARKPEVKAVEDLHTLVRGGMEKLIDYLASNEIVYPMPVFHQIEKYIEGNLAKDLSLKRVAQKFHISYSYLSTVFRKMSNQGFVDYVTSLRIARAKEYLQNPSLKIKDVARMIGYPNVVTFNRNFRKHEAVSPHEYRRKILLENLSDATDAAT